MDLATKLKLLRSQMEELEIDYYLVPSSDPHNSEYLPTCFQRRIFISHFTGSAGDVLVGLNQAYLSTDGRYFLQAEQELDPKYYSLLKQSGYTSAIEDFLKTNCQQRTIAVDPQLISIKRAEGLLKLAKENSFKLKFISQNLIDKINFADNLKLPTNKAYLLAEQFNGMPVLAKITLVQNWLKNTAQHYLALNSLDEINWLFNLRGSDIDYNPLVLAYALIHQTQVFLFIDKDKLDNELRQYFINNQIQIKEYNEFYADLSIVDNNIAMDPKTANYAMYLSIKSIPISLVENPISLQKAVKNAVEIKGAKIAHQKDACAVIKFLAWLKNNWQSGVDEIQAEEKLQSFRTQEANNYGLSFRTISGYQENSAITHYSAKESTKKVIRDDSLYLIDSGGQYLEGTTDITRTIHLGTPSLIEKKHYTLVLKGHLALARAVFPKGVAGEHLDALARMALWQEGFNYRHGTGHGVGSFLCVHEGPQKISPAISNIALIPGMILSNEPGFYLDGQYGIRIENLCLVLNDYEKDDSIYGPFYRFEDLTLVPYAKNLMDKTLLTETEISQIQAYYLRIQTEVLPLIEDEIALAWLNYELDF